MPFCDTFESKIVLIFWKSRRNLEEFAKTGSFISIFRLFQATPAEISWSDNNNDKNFQFPLTDRLFLLENIFDLYLWKCDDLRGYNKSGLCQKSVLTPRPVKVPMSKIGWWTLTQNDKIKKDITKLLWKDQFCYHSKSWSSFKIKDQHPMLEWWAKVESKMCQISNYPFKIKDIRTISYGPNRLHTLLKKNLCQDIYVVTCGGTISKKRRIITMQFLQGD